IRTREPRSDEERGLHAVLCRLVDEHLGGSIQLLGVLGKARALLLEHIEVLPERDLAAHAVEMLAGRSSGLAVGARRTCAVHRLVGPRLEEIAEQDRTRYAEVSSVPTEALVGVQGLEVTVYRRP